MNKVGNQTRLEVNLMFGKKFYDDDDDDYEDLRDFLDDNETYGLITDDSDD